MEQRYCSCQECRQMKQCTKIDGMMLCNDCIIKIQNKYMGEEEDFSSPLSKFY